MDNQWIPVTEQLPEPGVRVIGYDEFYSRIGEAVVAGWNKTILVFIDSDDCKITHWLPMPEPPVSEAAREMGS